MKKKESTEPGAFQRLRPNTLVWHAIKDTLSLDVRHGAFSEERGATSAFVVCTCVRAEGTVFNLVITPNHTGWVLTRWMAR